MNVQEIIIDKVLSSLEKGIPAWVCPYRRIGLPENLDGRKYNGINIFVLSNSLYASNKWGTFKSFTQKGYYVKEGEKSSLVVGWFPQKYEVTDEETGEKLEKVSFVLRYFNVFNSCQTTMFVKEEISEIKILLPEIETFIKTISTFVPVKRGFTHIPHYKLAMHEVEVPPVENFSDIDEYYSALFHELIHSTMKPLDRKISLSQEELVAEIGASMLCQTFGVLKTLENSVAYCANWAKKIKDKEVNIIKCASFAEKAVEFLLNYKEEK